MPNNKVKVKVEVKVKRLSASTSAWFLIIWNILILLSLYIRVIVS
jgi:hypothetical protein